jgi:hypothetical protein
MGSLERKPRSLRTDVTAGAPVGGTGALMLSDAPAPDRRQGLCTPHLWAPFSQLVTRLLIAGMPGRSSARAQRTFA